MDQLVRGANKMQWLDVSFVRAVDDLVVKKVLEGMPALELLFVRSLFRLLSVCS